MEFKEITAKTVDEAITKACLEFETSSDNSVSYTHLTLPTNREV